MVPVFRAPLFVSGAQHIPSHTDLWPYLAAFLDEPADRACHVLQEFDHFRRGCGLDEVLALAQPPQPLNGPIQDARKLAITNYVAAAYPFGSGPSRDGTQRNEIA